MLQVFHVFNRGDFDFRSPGKVGHSFTHLHRNVL
jgi:hypothetical protein